MFHLEREALPSATAGYLQEKSAELEALDPDLRDARAAELWQSKSRTHFRTIRLALRNICSGNERCMYCEDSAGAHIDHFRPRAMDSLSTFVWENYLLACSICNSNYKRDEFPLDPSGNAQLVDPTVDEPQDHLMFSSATGRYEPVPGSTKADESIRVFGLNRAVLETARRDAWQLFEIGIVAYGKALDDGKSDKAEQIGASLRRLPCAGVLQALVDVVRDTDLDFVDPECRAVVGKRSEIYEWCH